MRVHALAKEYGIKSTEFVDIIQEFGIGIKSHLSVLDDGQVSDIRYKMKERGRLLDEYSNGGDDAPLKLTESDLDEVSFDEYDDGEESADDDSDGSDGVDSDGGDIPQVEETVITEDEWEFTDSEEVDELFEDGQITQEDIDEAETSSIGDAIGSEDTVVESTEPVNLEEVAKEIDANAKAAAEARERYAQSVSEINKTSIDETEEREKQLENLREKSKGNLESQQVIVEKPKGFWGWLKSLFT